MVVANPKAALVKALADHPNKSCDARKQGYGKPNRRPDLGTEDESNHGVDDEGHDEGHHCEADSICMAPVVLSDVCHADETKYGMHRNSEEPDRGNSSLDAVESQVRSGAARFRCFRYRISIAGHHAILEPMGEVCMPQAVGSPAPLTPLGKVRTLPT